MSSSLSPPPASNGDFSFPSLSAGQHPQQQATHYQHAPFSHQQQQPQQVALQPPAAHVQLHQPVKPQAAGPLTARSTVVHASSATAAGQQQAAGAGSMAPPKPLPITQVQAEGRRNKVPLEKGFSQVTWIKMMRSDADLTGGHGSGRRDIKIEEVQQHRTPDDAWIVLHGKVYNITPYIRFHPGGADILIKAAGKDATSLFNRYHPWVNAHALLDKCLIGLLEKPEGEGTMAGCFMKSPLSKLFRG